MTRLYGRIEGGQRLVDSIPGAQWKMTSIVSSMRFDGSTTAMTIDGPFDANAFKAYVVNILCPVLRKNDIVVMDNLPAHKCKSIQEAIEKTGAELWFLPPYSPDFNPIEKMWSKIKAYLRMKKARTKKALNKAISESLELIDQPLLSHRNG